MRLYEQDAFYDLASQHLTDALAALLTDDNWSEVRRHAAAAVAVADRWEERVREDARREAQEAGQ